MARTAVKLYCATANPGKVREFQDAARHLHAEGVTIEMLPGIEQIAVPEETGETFQANAELKARYYSGFTEELVFADDSGLCVEALHGEPGVYSARYGGPGLDDAGRIALLLSKLRDHPNRRGSFECVIAVARRGEVLRTFQGTVSGEILTAPRTGAHGFGYDPIFYYPPLALSFAEVPAEAKRAVSHRGQALRQLLAWLESKPV